METDIATEVFLAELKGLRFGSPAAYVYNPLEYARTTHDRYLELYGTPPKEAVFVGMNPGPWGMAQTGVPFGEVTAVRDWLGIAGPVGVPFETHPKKPVLGFSCQKSEVSGKRLWGWAMETFGKPENFFSRFFVANYCPLLFLDASGRNVTPDKLAIAERKPLLAVCDRALGQMVRYLRPRYVIGVGAFAADRAAEALGGTDVVIGKISHPSPANPRANRGWAKLANDELAGIGIELPNIVS